MLEDFGKYTLLERLGYGGMAEVFLARTAGIGGFEKLLAIKRLLPYCVEDQQTVDLLADEARITVQLTHPNIVQVFDFGRVDDSYFMAMEYVDGLDLKTLIEDEEGDTCRALPIDVALHIAISVLEGLHFAHHRRDPQGEELGIIHRDVTPHNLLISRQGQVKLTDFGVARARISIHVSMVGDIRGKFSYMPPEQACGGEIDQRVDIFAAGAILFEMLTGRAAFRSTSSGEQMKLLLTPIASPSDLVPAISRELDQVVLKALHKDPAKRFSDAGAMASLLRRELERQSDAMAAQRRLAALVEARLRRTDRFPTTDAPILSLAEHPQDPERSLISGEVPRKISSNVGWTGPPESAQDFGQAVVRHAALTDGPIAFAETIAVDRTTLDATAPDTLDSGAPDSNDALDARTLIQDNPFRITSEQSGLHDSPTEISSDPGGVTRGGFDSSSDEVPTREIGLPDRANYNLLPSPGDDDPTRTDHHSEMLTQPNRPAARKMREHSPHQELAMRTRRFQRASPPSGIESNDHLERPYLEEPRDPNDSRTALYATVLLLAALTGLSIAIVIASW